jgi:hypothetical protein
VLSTTRSFSTCGISESFCPQQRAAFLSAAACCLSKINAERLRNVPPFVVAVRRPYEAALIDVGVTDRNDPITELIAKSIVNVTASCERDPKEVMERALNALGVRSSAA